MPHGFVYIARNENHNEDTFKVGMTRRSVADRLRELTEDTSNLGQFVAVAYFMVTDADEAERICHKRLEEYRLQANREFFQIPAKTLIAIVQGAVAPFLTSAFIGESIGDAGGAELASAVRSRAETIRHQLGPDLLRCHIPQSVDEAAKRLLCAFSVLSILPSRPLVLRQRGYRADTGDVEAPDDGCIGTVSVRHQFARENEPRIVVQAHRVRYDGVLRQFAKSGERASVFSRANEAMDLVEKVLRANLASPQQDVRWIARETNSGPFVYDCGVFDLSAFDRL
jgi:hypothetical protein